MILHGIVEILQNLFLLNHLLNLPLSFDIEGIVIQCVYLSLPLELLSIRVHLLYGRQEFREPSWIRLCSLREFWLLRSNLRHESWIRQQTVNHVSQ